MIYRQTEEQRVIYRGTESDIQTEEQRVIYRQTDRQTKADKVFWRHL